MSRALRLAIFSYGILAYLSFFGTISYAIAFVGDFLVPKTINRGGVTDAAWPFAFALNAGLLLLFAIQHTIMARPWFKRWLTRWIPAAMERSTFVIAASLCLCLMFWQWRPLPQVVWQTTDAGARLALMIVQLFGWLIVFGSSFVINHFDLFGLRQVWLHLRIKAYEPLAFRVTGIYKLVRHPLMLGFLIAFWVVPTMTVGHLFFAILITAYILVGTRFEERDLEAHFGERYRQYQRHVPAFIPWARFSSASTK